MDRTLRPLPEDKEVSATFAPKTESAVFAYLRASGWVQQPRQKGRKPEWRHKAMHWPWTTLTAAQLQRETDEGMMDPAHRMLRGEP